MNTKLISEYLTLVLEDEIVCSENVHFDDVEYEYFSLTQMEV